MTKDILLVIDLQNDFMPGGALAVPEGDRVVQLVNRLAARFTHVVLTQDWHPPGHFSFASSHPGKAAFATVEAPYGRQVLWPDHCIQGSEGAALHRDVAITHAELILRKGYGLETDSYSAFREADGKATGLAGYLRERGFAQIFLAGLALDFCVAWTARDAAAAGFTVTVIEDACRAIDANGSLRLARADMAAAGVSLMPSAALI
jgi:nicotinamidase/pyrazinamidase